MREAMMQYQCDFQNEYFSEQNDLSEYSRILDTDIKDGLCLVVSHIVVTQMCPENPQHRRMKTGEAEIDIQGVKCVKAIRFWATISERGYSKITLNQKDILTLLSGADIINLEVMDTGELYMLIRPEIIPQSFGLYFEYHNVQIKWDKLISKAEGYSLDALRSPEWAAKMEWKRPPEVFEKAMRELEDANDDEFAGLIMPGHKSSWENAALALSRLGYPRIKPIVSRLFSWLEDMCWPGAETTFQLLKTVPANELEAPLLGDLKAALKLKDDAWFYTLYRLMTETGQTERFAELLTDEPAGFLLEFLPFAAFVGADMMNADLEKIRQAAENQAKDPERDACINWLLDIAEKAGI